MSWASIVAEGRKILGVGETPLQKLQVELIKLLNGPSKENPGGAAKDAFALILTHNNLEKGWTKLPSMRWQPQHFIEKVQRDNLSSSQVLFLLALSAVPRKSGMDWRPSLRLLEVIAADLPGTFAALESFFEGEPGPTANSLALALTSLFDRACQPRHTSNGATFEEPAWVGASPLLVASEWQKINSKPSLPTLRVPAHGADAAHSYIEHLPGAARMCDPATGLCAAIPSLHGLLTRAAPTVEALVELLMHFAVEEGSAPDVPKRFAELVRAEPVWKLLSAMGNVEKLSESWRACFASPWGSELFVALRALRHADSSAIFEVDVKGLVDCIATVPLTPFACEGILSEAAELAIVLPDLLPCLLREVNASAQLAPLISVVSLQAARNSARKWLGLTGRRGAHALFVALQQFYQQAEPSANSLVDLPAALYQESREVSRALGLPKIMGALRGLQLEAGTRMYSFALRIVHELAADLATTAAAREAMQELVSCGQLDTELAAEAAAAVLDCFNGRVSLEASRASVTASATLRTALLQSAGRFWTLVVGMDGLYVARVQEHGARKRIVETVRSFGTSLQIGSLSVADFRAVTDEECRPSLLLLLQLCINRDLSAEVAAAEDRICTTQEDLMSVAWLLEQCGATSDCTAERAKLTAVRAALPQTALDTLGSPEFWGILGCVLPAATSLRPLHGCALFTAVWVTQIEAVSRLRMEPEAEPVAAAAEESLPVPPDMATLVNTLEQRLEMVVQRLGMVDVKQQRQQQQQQPFALSDILGSVVPATRGQIQELGLSAEVTCGSLDAVRYRITDEAADDEARSVVAFIAALDPPPPDFDQAGLTRALAHRLRAYSRREQAVKTAAHMELFLEACGVAGGNLQARLHEAAAAAMDSDSRCNVLHEILEASSEALVASGFTDILDLVRVLGTTKGIELLNFLRTAADDLRALINSVEERGGGQLRAETVGDVIKVRSALAALLDLETVSRRRQLDDASLEVNVDDEEQRLAVAQAAEVTAAEQASILEALRPVAQTQGILLRIEACCAHVHALKRLHSSLGNRQGLLRFTVSDIVKRGRYMFSSNAAESRCQIHVSVGETVLDEVQLRDMHDSMRLQQHNKRLEAESAAVEEKEEGDHNEGEGATNAEIDSFLAWGIHAQAIVDSVSELRLLGCIDYRDYEILSLPGAELERKAEEEMQAAADFRAILAAQRSACVYLTFFNGPQLWQLSDALLGRESADGADEAAATALLQYVHPGAELPPDEMFPKDGEWLVRLSDALVSVFDAVIQDRDEEVAATPPAAIALIPPGSVSVISCQSGAMVTALVGLFAAASALPPRRCQLLACDADTSDEEVATFLLRVVMSPQERLFRHFLFIIIHVERLSMAVHLSLTARLLELHGTLAGGAWRLAVLCDGSQRQPLLDDFRGRVVEDCARSPWWPALPISERLLFEGGRRVTVVTSDRPGLGKSTYITNRVGKHSLKHLLLAGSVSCDELVVRLHALALQPEDALSLQLRQGRDRATTEGLLYELTQLRCVQGTTAVFLLPRDVHIFIEVANPSVGSVDTLLAQLPLLSAFERVTCDFALEDITVNDDDEKQPNPRAWLSDCQVVCLHLALLEANAADALGVCGIVDNDRLDLLGEMQQEAAPLESGDCQRLLNRYFFEVGQGEPSFAALDVFLRVLAAQLRRFVGHPMSMLLLEEEYQAGGAVQGPRTCVLVALVAMARDFAIQSVHAARTMQTSNLERLSSAELEVAASVERMVSLFLKLFTHLLHI